MSILALVLLDELKRRLAQRDCEMKWNDIRRDLLPLAEVEVRQGEQWYHLRTALKGVGRQGAPGHRDQNTLASPTKR